MGSFLFAALLLCVCVCVSATYVCEHLICKISIFRVKTWV